MENQMMTTLSLNEMKAVNGGFWPAVLGYIIAAGGACKALNYIYSSGRNAGRQAATWFK